jgi:hypothetical protein
MCVALCRSVCGDRSSSFECNRILIVCDSLICVCMCMCVCVCVYVCVCVCVCVRVRATRPGDSKCWQNSYSMLKRQCRNSSYAGTHSIWRATVTCVYKIPTHLFFFSQQQCTKILLLLYSAAVPATSVVLPLLCMGWLGTRY